MLNSFPLINGINYAWASITLRFLTVDIKGVAQITYKEAQDIEGQMGAGSAPVSMGYGNQTFTGTLDLYLETLQDLIKLSPTGRIQDLPPFPIIVQFLSADGKFVTHTLTSVVLKEMGVDSKSGDKAIKSQIPLFIGQIIWK